MICVQNTVSCFYSTMYNCTKSVLKKKYLGVLYKCCTIVVWLELNLSNFKVIQGNCNNAVGWFSYVFFYMDILLHVLCTIHKWIIK